MSNALFLTNQRAELASSRHINWYLQVIKTNSVPGCYQVERGLSVDHFKLPRDSSTSSPDEAAWHCLAMFVISSIVENTPQCRVEERSTFHFSYNSNIICTPVKTIRANLTIAPPPPPPACRSSFSPASQSDGQYLMLQNCNVCHKS